MSSPLLARHGAVGEIVPAHYGDPVKEQRLFESGDALVDCSHYEVLTLTGPDRLVWLDSLASQYLADLAPGDTRESLILDPQGHIEHRFLITDDGETAWLLVEPGRLESLQAWLSSMRFRMRVDILDRRTDLAVVASTKGDSIASEIAVNVWHDPWPGVTRGGAAYSASPQPGEGLSLFFTAVLREDLHSELSEQWAGVDALDAMLVRAARPTLADVDEKTLPHELDFLRTAVHLNKGCYRGQETIAKVHNLGHPPRRAILLHLDGSEGELPEVGSGVMAEGQLVGRITRAVRHHEWGPLAYGVVKRALDPLVALVVEGPSGAIPATQEMLVLPDSGATRREALAARRNAH